MSEALERVIAKSEIYDLSCKYMRGLDRLDIELLKSVFTAPIPLLTKS